MMKIIISISNAYRMQQLSIQAYVLMSNHVHLLASPKTENSISKTMQSVGRCYVQHVNDMYSRTGTLWEGEFQSHGDKQWPIFVDLNAVYWTQSDTCRHGSLWANADDNKNKLITQHALYRHLGTDAAEWQYAYHQLFRTAIGRSDLDAIREATNKGWVLDNDRFRERIERLSERALSTKTQTEASGAYHHQIGWILDLTFFHLPWKWIVIPQVSEFNFTRCYSSTDWLIKQKTPK